MMIASDVYIGDGKPVQTYPHEYNGYMILQTQRLLPDQALST